MVIQATCPDPDVIRDLLNGNLPEVEQSELSSHFDLCPTCQQQFDAEASDPRFLGDVARLCSDADWRQNTPTLDRLMRDMPQQLSDAADEASVVTWSTEAVADFLDTSENADHIGRLGIYEIVEVIGRGGMGIVLRGIDSRLNRVVAIKVLAPELASNPNARRRFYREGQAAAAVSHDHVVTIHAVDDHERLPYLVMEFVAGESLEECIRRTGALPLEAVLRMGRQAALGLAAAHEVGLVHRDMKPANILLENGIQRVRITDFGLARATDDVSMTQTGTVSGTPLYMSPEQAGGETVDHRSDLFSLGSVFYAMCTGRPAFRAQTTLAVIKRVCEDTPRAIRDVNPDIPQWLVDIIDRLMAKQPDERIQSSGELAELLGNHLAHLQDPDNVAAPAGVEAKPAPKHRTLKSLLLAVLLIGGVGLGITEAAGVTEVGKFLGIVLRLKTPEGILVIEIEDPDVEVSVDGSEVVLSGITKKELRLTPGKYQYRATRKGEPVESDWVTIERDGKTVVRIQQLTTEIPGATAALHNAPDSPNPSVQSVRAVDLEKWTRNPNDLKSHRADSKPLPTPPEDIPAGAPPRRSFADGISLLTPVRIRRFVPDQFVPVWFGKWYFKNIPEQLYGRNFAFTSREGGLLEFEMPRSGNWPRGQRIWLLIPHQDWDGSQTTSIPEDHDPTLKFARRDSLIAFGWSPWNDITGEHIRTHPDQPIETMKWSVFYQDAKPGRFSIRTHWKHTPMLVWGSTKLDDVIVERQRDQRIAVFGQGATVPLANGSSIFNEVPDHLIGRLYTKRNGYSGAARFSVQRDQKVTVAMYEWGHENEGNASGSWKHELTSREQMAQDGWQEVGELKAGHSDRELPDTTWFLYTRNCKAGESFTLRNHKYQAPIVFSEKTYFDAGPIDFEELSPNQHAQIHAEGRLAKLVEEFNSMIESGRYAEAKVIAERAKQDFPNSPVVDAMLQGSRMRQPSVSASSPKTSKTGPPSLRPLGDTPIDESMLQPNFIRLDSSKMKTQFTGRVSEPGVFGTRGPMSFHGEQPVLFFTRKPEERSVGYGLLVGQVPVTNQGGERFELERFDRTGNEIRVVFRQHTQNSDFLAVTNQRGFYADPATEKFLQSGLLAIENRIKDRLSDGSREKVLSSPFNGAIRSSRQNLGSTLLGSIRQIRHLEVLRPRLSLLTELQRERRKRIEEARTAFREELKWYSEGIAGLKKTAERGGLLLQSEQETVERGEVGVTNSQQGLIHCTRQEALLHETGSKEYQNLMLQAAQEFKVLYETNREKSAGQFARLWQARCMHDVGEFARANSIYSALLASTPSADPMLKLLTYRALQFKMSAIIDGQLEDPGIAIGLASEWLTSASDRERRSSTGASIMWEQARAMYVAALPKGFDLPHPTPAPVSAGSVLAGRLRKMTRVLLRWPGISTGKFKPQATILNSMLQQQFTDDVPYGRQPRRLYFQTPLPTLPPGEYTITASVAVALGQDQPLTKPTAPSTGKPTATPSPEEATTVTGKLSVPVSDPDAAEFKRVAVLAVVMRPAENEALGRQLSSPLNIDLSELITRIGQLEDVNGFPGDPERLRHYLDDLSQAGKKWAMCAALDLENADSKIHAARALAKLADPDTVAVLLIAAKRNAYGIMGSENATIHSLYQAELKLALEAATGLKLTPSGLTLKYEHTDEVPPRTVVHRSELNPEMFRSETDFKRVDDWLRSVYLADSEIPAVPESDAEGTIPTAKSIHTGLIGRMSIRTLISNGPGKSSTIKHVDPGYVFQYSPGQFFHRDILPLKQIRDRNFVVNLTGQLDVPRDIVVKIWHAGGGVSHDECGLYLDGALIGVVGDDRDKHNIYEVPLLKGRHDVRWELSGGTFRTNVLLFQDSETKRYLPIINSGPESVRKASADRIVVIQSSRTDWPVSAKPDWLPPITETPLNSPSDATEPSSNSK